MDKRVKETIGILIGDFIVIDYSKDKKKYLCKCQKCGEEKYLSKSDFKRIGSILCKCTRSGVNKGDKYYKLTALQRDMSRLGEGRVQWLWQCDCGNIISAPLNRIKNGNTKSCGCLNNEKRLARINKINSQLEDLTGMEFTRLTVIRQATSEEILNRPKGSRYWYCKCQCGADHIVSTSDLKGEKVKSCGCLISYGEEKIANLLFENNICYQKSYIFSDLKAQRQLRYDFAILDSDNNLMYLIEYDGIQHFSERDQFQKGTNSFKKNQIRDELKNKYCLEKNIPLIRIPYTHLKKITIDDLKLETSTFILKGDDEENA